MLEPKEPMERHIYNYTLPSMRDEGGMWLHWLVRMRWAALVAMVIVVTLAWPVLTSKTVVLPAMLLVFVTMVVANMRALARLEAREQIKPAIILNHMYLDVGMLTVMLLLSGGHHNPFVPLFLVHVVMAGVMLRGPWAVGVATWALTGFLVTHVHSFPLDYSAVTRLPAGQLEAIGDLLAMVITGGACLFFAMGMANSLRRREQQLVTARRQLGTPMTEEVGLRNLTDLLEPDVAPENA